MYSFTFKIFFFFFGVKIILKSSWSCFYGISSATDTYLHTCSETSPTALGLTCSECCFRC